MPIKPEVIEDLKAKYPGVRFVSAASEADDVEIILRAPDRAAWKKFRRVGSDPDKRDTAAEVLLRDTLVAVSGCDCTDSRQVFPVWDRILGESPWLGDVLVGKALEALGIGDQGYTAKKI